MCDISSESAIRVLKEYISIWGLPHQIVSDNEPAFASEQFQEFVLLLSIRKLYRHPASNGAAENAVHTFKKKFKVLLTIIQDRMPYVNICFIVARHHIVRRKRHQRNCT